jgi:Putative MetA-pathway of phenol degradation
MNPRRRHPAARLALLVLLAPAPVGATEESTARYHLFRPVPSDELRELSTDRPDQTESPYTVDAGHVQFEVDVVNLSRDTERDVRAEHLGVAAMNVKVGLTNRADLQLIAPLFERERRTGAFDDEQSGFGDLTLRLKVNAWGNDGGPSSLGVMPFVSIATVDSRDAAWGSSVLFAFALPHGFDLGSMLELDVRPDASEWLGTLTVGHVLVGPLGGYLELAGTRVAHGDGEPRRTVNSGLTWAVSRDVQLDGGVLVGLNDAADDYAGFLGFAVRR